MPIYTTLLYEKHDRIANIILNRPERLNAINDEMPGEIEAAVGAANDDDDIHVIIVSGAGDAFCSGYDLKHYAQSPDGNQFVQDMPWDPMLDYKLMKRNTDQFASLWHSYKPTIARVHGHCVAGGTDIALSCDFVIMEATARIGYPPTRVWGCPSTGMWVHRIGAQAAKRMLFTGDLVSGTEAKELGLALEAPEPDDLDARVDALAQRMAGVPKNQLMMQKLMINQAIDASGLANTQMIATLFDGITRHSPEGMWFKEKAEAEGFKAAVRHRDSGEPIPEGRAALGKNR
jgi:enoyl-CoA hydratase